MKPYSSLLIVRHETHSDVYIKGVQIGVIKNGEFEHSQAVNQKDGSKKPVEIDYGMLDDAYVNIYQICRARTPLK